MTSRYVHVLSVVSESGDRYGPFAFERKPSADKLEAWLRKQCPGEWDDGYGQGPGFRGSYLYPHWRRARVCSA